MKKKADRWDIWNFISIYENIDDKDKSILKSKLTKRPSSTDDAILEVNEVFETMRISNFDANKIVRKVHTACSCITIVGVILAALLGYFFIKSAYDSTLYNTDIVNISGLTWGCIISPLLLSLFLIGAGLWIGLSGRFLSFKFTDEIKKIYAPIMSLVFAILTLFLSGFMAFFLFTIPETSEKSYGWESTSSTEKLSTPLKIWKICSNTDLDYKKLRYVKNDTGNFVRAKEIYPKIPLSLYEKEFSKVNSLFKNIKIECKSHELKIIDNILLNLENSKELSFINLLELKDLSLLIERNIPTEETTEFEEIISKIYNTENAKRMDYIQSLNEEIKSDIYSAAFKWGVGFKLLWLFVVIFWGKKSLSLLKKDKYLTSKIYDLYESHKEPNNEPYLNVNSEKQKKSYLILSKDDEIYFDTSSTLMSIYYNSSEFEKIKIDKVIYFNGSIVDNKELENKLESTLEEYDSLIIPLSYNEISTAEIQGAIKNSNTGGLCSLKNRTIDINVYILGDLICEAGKYSFDKVNAKDKEDFIDDIAKKLKSEKNIKVHY